LTVQYQAFSLPILAILVLAGIAVAMIGAVLPARWAARTAAAEVLHSE
jgi:putative ABC transport system permease protein